MQTNKTTNPIELCLRVSACLPLIALLAVALLFVTIEAHYARKTKK